LSWFSVHGASVPLQEASAQVPEQSIYPSKSGQELITALRNDYFPNQTLGYDVARDDLYRYLDTRDGVLIGVYGGYSVDIPAGQDPSSTAYQNGSGISAEHTWPQSKGAGSEPQKSDMHHLFPVKQTINSARSNRPYDEITDTATDTWYINDTSQSSVPSSNIDSYSENDGSFPSNATYSSRFEPREDHKGNAARAVFYYYVIYNSTISDPDFFDAQRDDLLQWHSQDAVDQDEYDRSQWIAAQQGTNNPFVLDPTLAERAFGTASGSPSVTLANASQSVGEGDGSATVTVQINNPDGNAVDVDLAFDAGASTADASDVGSYATQTVSFSGAANDGDQQAVTITLTDDMEPEPLESARFALQNVSTTGSAVLGSPSSTEVSISDNDGGVSGDLVISQYVETDSGTEPKGIELWNATGSEIDFSATPLRVEKYVNGAPASSPTTEFTLSTGTLAADAVMVIGGGELQTYMQTNASGVDFYNDSFSFNGNDALEVVLGGTTEDVFGTIGSDPGTAWTGGGVSTANSNIQLLSGITSGTTTGFTDPSTRFETVSADPFDLTGFGEAPGPAAPLVQFTAATQLASEGDGSADLNVELLNPDGNEITVDVAFQGGSSTADGSDIGSFTSQTVTFGSGAAGGAQQTVSVPITDDLNTESTETATFALQNLATTGSAALGSPSSTEVSIADNDGGASGGFIISQYAEDGNIKGIELWNATGAPIDFSSTPLRVERYANGSTSPTTDFNKNTGTLATGDVLVLADGGANNIWANEGIAFEDASLNFNGNDAIEIVLGGTTTDVFGTIGNDPGTAWTGSGVSTRDQNIQLLPGVVTGDADGWTDPSTRFETVATDPLDDGAGDDLTGFGVAPGTFTELVITGTSGNEGTAADGSLGGDAGWRMVGPPVTGARVGDIVSNVRSPFVINNITQGDQLYRWDDANGAWEVLNNDADSFESGRGHILFFFDDDEGPITDSGLTLDMSAGTVTNPTSDQTVSVDPNASFHLVANPFNQAFNLNALENSSGTALSVGGTGFQTTVQIWDGGSTDGERGSTKGSYETVDISSPTDALAPGGRLISAWQGFFVERGTATDTELVFNSTGTTSADRSIVGSSAEGPSSEPLAARIGLEMTVADEGGTQVARDAAASVTWREAATTAWDAFDATKLTPLASSYATIGPVGPTSEGTTALKAQESRPWPQSEALITVPMDLELTGGIAGTATLESRDWQGVPPEWEITLVDTKGTTDPSDDEAVAWTPEATYTFALDASSSSSATAHRSRAHTSRAHTSRSSRTATRGGLDANAMAPPRPEALNAQRPASMLAARAPGTGSPTSTEASSAEASASGDAQPSNENAPPRFVLEVDPSAGPLPVELQELTVQQRNQRAQLQWTTASETNNAGFYVETQPLASGDSTTTASAWTTLGFVEGTGTTDVPQSYQFETGELKYGEHAFRLRQVDTGGTETTTDPVTVEVHLSQAYVVEAPYPNPARGPVTLPVTVSETQRVQVILYDMLGRRIATVHDGEISGQDTRSIQLDTGGLASGTYFVRVRGQGFVATERLTVVR
jgi:endonuclease I